MRTIRREYPQICGNCGGTGGELITGIECRLCRGTGTIMITETETIIDDKLDREVHSEENKWVSKQGEY